MRATRCRSLLLGRFRALPSYSYLQATATSSRLTKSIVFKYNEPEGAVLAITSEVEPQMLPRDCETAIHKWISENAEILYKYACTKHLHRHEDLYIVTGCFKAENWAMASYQLGQTMQPEQTLKLVNNSPDVVLPGCVEYLWEEVGLGASTSTSEAKGYPPGLKDQSLFLQGFKLTINRSITPSVQESVSVGAHSPATSSARLNHRNDRGHSHLASNELHFGTTSNHSSLDHSDHQTCLDRIIESVAVRGCHPPKYLRPSDNSLFCPRYSMPLDATSVRLPKSNPSCTGVWPE